jgi:hypothetical protein
MPRVILEDMTPEQDAVVWAFINEGKMQAYEELIKEFEIEHFSVATEDPYYAYYIKHVIGRLHELYDPLVRDTE